MNFKADLWRCRTTNNDFLSTLKNIQAPFYDFHGFSTLLRAATAFFQMPAKPGNLNPAHFLLKEPGLQAIHPKSSKNFYARSSVEEGKEVELTASVQDIEDGNMVTLQVFPEDGVPIASFPLTVKGGSVSAKWSYHANKSELPPDSDPKFVFSAHCAWCNFEKSSNSVEVKLIRPEITKAEWQDKDGGSTSKGLVGETLKLHAETKDMEGGVTFRVYDDKGRQVFEKGADIEGDKAEAEWTYHWNGEKLEEKPKFTFEVTGQRCKRVESSEVEICGKIEVQFVDKLKEPLSNLEVILIDKENQENSIATDSDGIIKKDDVIPGKYSVKTKNEFEIKKINGIDIYNIVGSISIEEKNEVVMNFEQKENS